MTVRNNTSKRWLILSLEIASRELTGKLLVCAEATRREWNCIVTTRRSIIRNINQLPIGVVLVKSAHGADFDYLKLLKEHGHKIVCLDEEGLVQRSLAEMVRVRSSENAIALVDRYMTWGKLQYEAYVNQYAKYKGKFGITGNTRADIVSGIFLVNTSQTNNVPVFRLSEVYLIAAEAAFKESDFTNARINLNAIVERADPSATVNLAGVTLDRILLERRKEFVAEGHRFFDLIRNKKDIVRTKCDRVWDITTPLEIKYDYYKILFPIPIDEMQVNTNIEQNPGY